MDLLDQVYELLGEEEISRQEFADILEAGFRRDHCRYDPSERGSYRGGRYGANPSETGEGIVFLGVNDGNIRKNASRAGSFRIWIGNF